MNTIQFIDTIHNLNWFLRKLNLKLNNNLYINTYSPKDNKYADLIKLERVDEQYSRQEVVRLKVQNIGIPQSTVCSVFIDKTVGDIGEMYYVRTSDETVCNLVLPILATLDEIDSAMEFA